MNKNYPTSTTLELISSVRNKQIASGANMTRKELSYIFTMLQKDIESDGKISTGKIFNNTSISCNDIFDKEVPFTLRHGVGAKGA